MGYLIFWFYSWPTAAAALEKWLGNNGSRVLSAWALEKKKKKRRERKNMMKKKKKKQKGRRGMAPINGSEVLDAEWPIRSKMEVRREVAVNWLEATFYLLWLRKEERKKEASSTSSYCWTIEIGRTKELLQPTVRAWSLCLLFFLNVTCACLLFLTELQDQFATENKTSKHTHFFPFLLGGGGGISKRQSLNHRSHRNTHTQARFTLHNSH